MKHSLTNKNRVDLVADCSVCGPGVPIKLNGPYGIRCVKGHREARRNYKLAHPERARSQKAAATGSAHRLEKRTGEMDTCSVCGPVKPTAWGRGWMCPTILKERGWAVIQTVPNPQCLICKRYLDKYGACPSCDDDFKDLDARYMPAEARPMKKLMAQLDLIPDGFSITSSETPLPAETESVVPGWKTLGPGPNLSADEWMRQNGHQW